MAVFPCGWGRYAPAVMLIEIEHRRRLKKKTGGQQNNSDDTGEIWDIFRVWGRCGEIETEETEAKNSLFIVQFLGKMNWLQYGNRHLSRHGNVGIN